MGTISVGEPGDREGHFPAVKHQMKGSSRLLRCLGRNNGNSWCLMECLLRLRVWRVICREFGSIDNPGVVSCEDGTRVDVRHGCDVTEMGRLAKTRS